MRCAIWSSVLVGLFIVGCREHVIHSAATENSESRSATKSNVDHVPSANPEAADSDESPPSGGAVVDFDGMILTAPSIWVRKPESSSFVAAEFSLPRADGDQADGRLTISTAGGTIEANIERWKGQFQPQPKVAEQNVVDISGLKVTFVDFSGDFNDQRGRFAPGEKRPGYRMIAAVIPVGGKLHFVKATGPERTISSHANAINKFVHSAKLNN
jgi:hypothetical protein